MKLIQPDNRFQTACDIQTLHQILIYRTMPDIRESLITLHLIV